MQARKYVQLIYSIYHGNETHEIFLIAMLATSTVAFLLNVSRSTSLRIKVALVEIYTYFRASTWPRPLRPPLNPLFRKKYKEIMKRHEQKCAIVANTCIVPTYCFQYVAVWRSRITLFDIAPFMIFAPKMYERKYVDIASIQTTSIYQCLIWTYVLIATNRMMHYVTMILPHIRVKTSRAISAIPYQIVPYSINAAPRTIRTLRRRTRKSFSTAAVHINSVLATGWT